MTNRKFPKKADLEESVWQKKHCVHDREDITKTWKIIINQEKIFASIFVETLQTFIKLSKVKKANKICNKLWHFGFFLLSKNAPSSPKTPEVCQVDF